jgi:hypothetical protein
MAHKCSHCKKEFKWNDESVWYGSYKDLDDWQGKSESPITKACSDSCGKHLWGSDYKDNIEANDES